MDIRTILTSFNVVSDGIGKDLCKKVKPRLGFSHAWETLVPCVGKTRTTCGTGSYHTRLSKARIVRCVEQKM